MSVLGDLDALQDCAADWWDLWRRDAGATPFQSPAWLIPWQRAFSPGPLHVVTLRRGARLAALAPLYRETSTDRLLPIGISLSDKLDVLAEDGAAANELLDLVLNEAPCARLEIENLDPAAHARRVDPPAGWSLREDPIEVCPFLELEPEWDAQVPARKRRQWRRALKEAQAHGDMLIKPVAEDPSNFLDHLGRLHRARWQTRDEAGVLADETVQTFHRLAAPELLAAGLARFYLLGFAGCVTGAYYGLAAKGRAYAYIGGFDPAFSHESPGTILLAHAMQQARQEGARRFEFLRGGEAYKYAWGARDAPAFRRIWERDQ